MRLPGVSFLESGEWAAAAVHDGKTARFGGLYPGAGGPDFLVNNPAPEGIEIRLTYWTGPGGTLKLYDGKNYRPVATLSETGHWATAVGRVPKELLASVDVDRPEPGRNLLFELACKDIRVHKIAVRAVPEGGRSSSATR